MNPSPESEIPPEFQEHWTFMEKWLQQWIPMGMIASKIRDATLADVPALAECVIVPTVTAFRGRVPEQCLRWFTRDKSMTNWGRWFPSERDEAEVLLVAEHRKDGVAGAKAARAGRYDLIRAGAQRYMAIRGM